MKRIVLCSDGTGNKEGKNNGTNVFRLYNSIERHDKDQPQLGFYDNGVGTEKFKIWKAFGGAFGFGFSKNICDLYTFLAKNYEVGDEIYLFGFSRGAATVRAFAGFLNKCGLVKNGSKLERGELHAKVHKAFKAYKKTRKSSKDADAFKKDEALHHPIHSPGGDIKIKFLGVWDTVSSLGFPKDLGFIIDVLEWGADKFIPHRFYDYDLNGSIQNAYHALAIDDQRQTFSPMVWDESKSPQTKIEQVWFAGMHSNVGGGYPRKGMSNEALCWMMARAHECGLAFKQAVKEEVKEGADVTGRMYDSRAGAAIYYRYLPRDLEALCKNKTNSIRIHESVRYRIEKGTAGYAPGNLPEKFVYVKEDGTTTSCSSKQYKERADTVKRVIEMRWHLHRVFLLFSLLVGGALILVAANNQDPITDPPWYIWALGWVVPKSLEPLLYKLLVDYIPYVGVVLGIFAIMWIVRCVLHGRCDKAFEKARRLFLKETASDP